MAVLFAEDFQGGSNGAACTTANTEFDRLLEPGWTFSNAQVEPDGGGTLSGRCAAAATHVIAQGNLASPAATPFLGFPLYVSARPAGNTDIVRFIDAAAGLRAGLQLGPAGGLRLRNSASVAVHTTADELIPLGTWCWIEWAYSHTAGTQQLRVYVGANRHGPTPDYDSGPVATTAAGAADVLGVGVITADTMTMFVGSVVVDGATWPARGVVGNTPPTVSAGRDQAGIEPFAAVTLAGAASDPDGTIVSRAWTQTGGTPVALSGAGSATATFTAPATLDGDTLAFAFTVTDDAGAIAADSLSVTVLPHNEWAAVGGALVPVQVFTPVDEADTSVPGDPGGGGGGGGGGPTPGPGGPPAPPEPPETIPPAVTVFDGYYRRKGPVPGYESCSVTWQYLGVGTGTLIVEETDPLAGVLLTAHTAVVPVVVDVNGIRWSGRVATAALERDGKPGTGTVTATLVDEWAWLRALLASQNGANPALTGMREYDTRSGPAATVAAYYINAAAARTGAPVVAVAPAGDTSPQVRLNARMQTLADLLTEPMTAANVAIPGALWLPGDPQPRGLNLTRPTVVFTPRPVVAKPWLRWSDSIGGIRKCSVVVNAADATSALLGLQGEKTARVYDRWTDTGLAASLGPYALPEMYVDATDIAAAGADSQARAREKAAEHRGTVSAAVEVADGEPWFFGEHYQVGDLPRLEIAGVPLQQRISRVTATDNRDGGLRFTPLIGDSAAAAGSDELIVAAVSSIARQLRQLQTGR